MVPTPLSIWYDIVLIVIKSFPKPALVNFHHSIWVLSFHIATDIFEELRKKLAGVFIFDGICEKIKSTILLRSKRKPEQIDFMQHESSF